MSTPRGDKEQSATRSAEEELRRRRERGRLSQARFRKRQSEASVELREENARMKDAIARVAAATRSADQTAILQAVQEAANVAGLDSSGMSDAHGRDQAIATSTASPSNLPEQEQQVTTATTITTGQDVPYPPEKVTYLQVRKCELYNEMLLAAHAAKEIHDASGSGRLSPRLDYGIWLDASRAFRVYTPPPEIVPYLGRGQYTFSGQLYWACAEYIASLCSIALQQQQQQQQSSSPSSTSSWFYGAGQQRPNAPEAERRVYELLQHSPPISSVRLAAAMVDAHRGYRDVGFVNGDHPVHGPDTGSALREKLESLCLARGEDLCSWLDVTQVEGYMRKRMGDEAFSRLDRMMVAHATPGGAVGLSDDPLYKEAHGILRMLIRGLAESYTCFGDGPRWRSDKIKNMLSFVEGVKAC